MYKEIRRRRRDIMNEKAHFKPVKTQKSRKDLYPCMCESGAWCQFHRRTGLFPVVIDHD